MTLRALPMLVAAALMLCAPVRAAEPPVPSFTCDDFIGAWKGRPVAELTAKWGEPTERKELSKGRARLVYDVRAATPKTEPTVPLDKAFPAAKPMTDVPGEPKGDAIPRPAAEGKVAWSKDDDGKWRAKSSEGGAAFPGGPSEYVFETDAAGTIVKVRCKD